MATPVHWVKDLQSTIKLYFFLEWTALLLTVADVRELDNVGGAGHGHCPAAAEDNFPWQPASS